jgi:carbamoyl-phosphate synthase small subunit
VTTTKHPAWLVLEDGSVMEGFSIGAEGTTLGEIVFNTSATGYQEILTDPSYKGQIVLMTYPEIGNYGVNSEDVESEQVHAAGFVVRRLSSVTSSWRAGCTLAEYLKVQGVVAIEGVDTRAITRKIRQTGAMKAGITTNLEDVTAFLASVQGQPTLDEQNLVSQVTRPRPRIVMGHKTRIENPVQRLVAIDFGMKENIIRCLSEFVETVIVLPATASFDDVMSYAPDGVFLSNGPGDPRTLDSAVQLGRELIAHKIPTFGICLGHQILALASGAVVVKMPFGHHGGNHPVKDLETGRIAITSQNHGYAVDPERLPADGSVMITHVNLNDGSVEGFRHQHAPIFSVQFHPEASPGPHDALYLFSRFIDVIQNAHQAKVEPPVLLAV